MKYAEFIQLVFRCERTTPAILFTLMYITPKYYIKNITTWVTYLKNVFFFYNLYWRILKYSFNNYFKYHTVMILWQFSKYKCISKRNISYNLLGFEPTNVESFMRYTGVSRWTITTINKLKIKLMNDISEIS